jgi:hypothetical protein
MSMRRIWRELRWWTRSARRSISGGWSDIWTLRRWMMWLRLGRAAVVLVVVAIGLAATVFGSHGSSSDAPAQQPALTQAQLEALCHEGSLVAKREARRYERDTGKPANHEFSEESCAHGSPPPGPADRE